MPLIQVANVRKEYKIRKKGKDLRERLAGAFSPKYAIKQAVDDLSFSIERGEMVGFIGPNGAGKSTMVKILSGILHPSGGQVIVNGIVPYKKRKEHVKRIGVVFGQKTQLWWDLPLIDSYEMLRYIYKVDGDRYKKSLGAIRELLALDEFLEQPVRQLSLGQRMKADIGAALLHEPDILFLDEPTIGLDVTAKENIRNFLVEMNRDKNITMLFTTHDMQDIEKTCRRIIIIDKGAKLYDGSIDAIKRSYDKERELLVDFSQDCPDIRLDNVEVLSEGGRKKRFRFQHKDVPVQTLIERLNRDYPIADLSIKQTEIEDIIREIYKKGMLEHERIH